MNKDASSGSMVVTFKLPVALLTPVKLNKGYYIVGPSRKEDSNSRSTADHHAAHPVGETVGEQAGNVIVHDLHLTTLERSDLIQANLVLLRVLEEQKKKSNAMEIAVEVAHG